MLQKLTFGLLLTAVLTASAYFGKQYFDEHYLLLNDQDVAALELTFKQAQLAAYRIGTQACNKTL
jgi:hypothetical protein